MIDLRKKWNIFKCLSFIQFIGKNELIIKIDKLNKDSIKGITISFIIIKDLNVYIRIIWWKRRFKRSFRERKKEINKRI